MHIVFLHGAWSSSKVFNYILKCLKYKGSYTLIDYSSKIRFTENLELLYQQVQDLQNVFFIAHSFGGIYASHLAEKLGDKCIGGVTLATPYGGIEGSHVLSMMFPSEGIFKDIASSSRAIKKIAHVQLPENWTSVVCESNSGVPWIKEPSDGVVTLNSQTARVFNNTVKVAAGHHEVLQDPVAVDIIKERLYNN